MSNKIKKSIYFTTLALVLLTTGKLVHYAAAQGGCPAGWYWDPLINSCWNSDWDTQWEPVPGTNEWINRTDGNNAFTVTMPSEAGQACSVRNRPCGAPVACKDTTTFNSATDVRPNGTRWREANCDRYDPRIDAPRAGDTVCTEPELAAAHTNPAGKEGECQVHDYKCVRRKTCGEINSDYDLEFDDAIIDINNQVFDADDNNKAGQDGLRCGRLETFSQPYWQVIEGNIYAQKEIRRDVSRSDQYVITADPETGCPLPVASGGGNVSAGIQQIGEGTGSVAGIPNYATQRVGASNTAAFPAFNVSDDQKQDFAYFQSLINYQSLNSCSGNVNGMSELDDSRVCTLTGDPHTSDPSLASLITNIPRGEKRVIFIDGNLIIDSEITTVEGAYLAFIVSQEVKVAKELGDVFNETASCFGTPCTTADQAHVQAVVIAGSIVIESTNTPYRDNPFNTDAFCDNRLGLAGTYVSWSGNIDLKRTFKGCGLNLSSITYPNCNKDHAAVTIFYRPDFLTSTPQWMAQPQMMRLETI